MGRAVYVRRVGFGESGSKLFQEGSGAGVYWIAGDMLLDPNFKEEDPNWNCKSAEALLALNRNFEREKAKDFLNHCSLDETLRRHGLNIPIQMRKGKDVPKLLLQLKEKQQEKLSPEQVRYLEEVEFPFAGLTAKAERRGIQYNRALLLQMKTEDETQHKILSECFEREETVHPQYLSLATNTGRITCVKPSITTLGKERRSAFVARKGHLLIELDFNAFDFHLAAYLSQCPKLMEFVKQPDFYAALREQKLSEKGVCLALLNDATSKCLMKDFKCSKVLADSYVFTFERVLQGLVKYKMTLMESAEKVQKVEPYPGLVITCEGRSKRFPFSAMLQGLGATVLKRCCLEVGDFLFTNHDSILFEVEADKVDGFIADSKAKIAQVTQQMLGFPISVKVKGPHADLGFGRAVEPGH